jgi:L-glyceraldehyde 3-phosphate reductase
LGKEGIGSVAFSPLAQGLLTDKYLKGIPKNSRASKKHGFLKKEAITPEKVEQVKKLNKLAAARNQSLAQMALAWVLKDVRITSVLVGASSPEQLLDAIKSIDNLHFEQQELMAIEEILIQGE